MKKSVLYSVLFGIFLTPFYTNAKTISYEINSISQYAKQLRQKSVLNSSVIVYDKTFLFETEDTFDLLSDFKIRYIDEYILLENKKIYYSIDGQIVTENFDDLEQNFSSTENYIKKIEIYQKSDITNNFPDFKIKENEKIEDIFIVNIVVNKEYQPDLLKINRNFLSEKISPDDIYEYKIDNGDTENFEGLDAIEIEKIDTEIIKDESLAYEDFTPYSGPIAYKLSLNRDFLAQNSISSQNGQLNSENEIIKLNETFSKSEKENYNLQIELNSEVAKNNLNTKIRTKNNIFRRVWQLMQIANQETKGQSDNGIDSSYEDNYEITSNYRFNSKYGNIESRLYATKANYRENYFSIVKEENSYFRNYASGTELSEINISFNLDRILNINGLNFGTNHSVKNLLRQSSWIQLNNNQAFYIPKLSNDLNVSEVKTEASVVKYWQLNPKISVVSGLTAQWFDFSQQEFNNNSEKFFAKPSLDFTYVPTKSFRMKFAYKKDQGRFYFGRTSFSQQVIDSNSDIPLRPETNQETSFEIEKSFINRAKIKLEVTNSDTENVIALIPIYNNGQIIGQKTGNFALNTSSGLEAEAYVPLEDYIYGLSLNTAWRLRSSGVLDPLSQNLDSLPSQNQRSFEFNIRQNIAKDNLVWGVFYKDKDGNTEYRYDEIVTNPRDTYWGMFLEYKGLKGAQIEAVLNNQINSDTYSYATKYNGVRTTGDINYINFRLNNQRPALKLTLRQSL